MEAQKIRDEEEIFDDLRALCKSPGYAHAIAYFCYVGNIVPYAKEITAEDMQPLYSYSNSRLVRTEISTLIGLMIQEDINYLQPTPDVFQKYLDQTDALLKEMHQAILPCLTPGPGDRLRESIFYCGESAYSFQYRDISPMKYANDDEWLKSNKGFSIQTARDVVHAIGRFQEKKLLTTMQGLPNIHPDKWTILPGYTFNVRDVAEISGIDDSTVKAVLNAFALPLDERNQGFTAISNFNVTNAMPLLRTNDGDFILFQIYSLVEALYESPYYWMGADEKYKDIAMRNRGEFTEAFCRKRLEGVFGTANVHANVKIYKSKNEVGEIDTLVIFGNRAIVLQAKSKQLTLEARKGNEGRIGDDFQKSVQKSYNQGLTCAKQLSESKVKLVGVNSKEITIPIKLKEVYILCAVSDHYPALFFQVRQFLECETIDHIQPPLVLDIFALDAITEMLQTPLYFLSYLNRRVNYLDKLIASHELTILSYHLKKNLWVSNETDMVYLEDDISANLDIAMMVRREGIEGLDTPDGILTRCKSTALGRIVTEIEVNPNPGTIDLGFLLLTLSEETVRDVSTRIDKIAQPAKKDHKNHDMTIYFDSASAGLTIHCNEELAQNADHQLQNHCELRKYAQKANCWFGICIHPIDKSLLFGISSNFEWRQNDQMDRMTQPPSNLAESLGSIGRSDKVGRNDPCPCGSGKKYKKCCLDR